MRNILLLVFFFSTAAGPVEAQKLIHDPYAEPRELGDFHSIQISGAMEVHLSQGDRPGLAVSARTPEGREGIQTRVHNGVLSISGGGGLLREGKARAYIGVRTLEKLSVSGAGNVIVTGELAGDELLIDLSGASDFKGAVNLEALTIRLSGASDVDIRGRAANLNIKSAGASHVRGYELGCDNCLVTGSGASEIKLTVNKVLNAEVSGASNIRFKGEGKQGNVRASGASSVSRVD